MHDKLKINNRMHKSRRALQKKVGINVVPVLLSRYVNMSLAFKKCIIQ